MRGKCYLWWSHWPIVTRSLVTVWLGATSRNRIFDEHALGTKRRIISVIKSKAFGDPIFSVCVNIILPSVSFYCEQLVSLNDHLHTCVCQVYLCLLTFFCLLWFLDKTCFWHLLCLHACIRVYVCVLCVYLHVCARARVCVCSCARAFIEWLYFVSRMQQKSVVILLMTKAMRSEEKEHYCAFPCQNIQKRKKKRITTTAQYSVSGLVMKYPSSFIWEILCTPNRKKAYQTDYAQH